MNTTTTRGVKQMSQALNQCQAELSDALLNSIEGQREEMVGLAQQGYGAIKQKAQQLLEKGAKAQEKLDSQVSDYNSKLEGAAKQHLPAEVNRMVLSYPWVMLAAAMALGAVVVWLLKPSFR